MVAEYCEHAKWHWIVWFKTVNFMWILPRYESILRLILKGLKMVKILRVY